MARSIVRCGRHEALETLPRYQQAQRRWRRRVGRLASHDRLRCRQANRHDQFVRIENRISHARQMRRIDTVNVYPAVARRLQPVAQFVGNGIVTCRSVAHDNQNLGGCARRTKQQGARCKDQKQAAAPGRNGEARAIVESIRPAHRCSLTPTVSQTTRSATSSCLYSV